MNFRITARTILHLGSELISSDGIAFYELIKNSLDARSSQIRVDVLSRLNFRTYDMVLRELGERRDMTILSRAPSSTTGAPPRRWRDLRGIALAEIDEDAPEADELRQEIQNADNREEFVAAIRSANRIDVKDDGDGMSIDTLTDVYLTIGTSHRAIERDATRSSVGTERDGEIPPRVILGEKGLGRLSAMRLGDAMEVITGTLGESRWNVLNINWNDFADAAQDDLSSIDIDPAHGDTKVRSDKGTLIRITALRSAWSQDKLEALAREQFSKLVDPFGDTRLPLMLCFNGAVVAIPPFADFILQHAHGVFTANYEIPVDCEPRLFGQMNYRLRKRRRHFAFQGSEIAEMAGDASRDTLRRLGPFTLQVYWFNRRVLTKIEGIGNLAQVRRLLAEWAGGVSLYRNGYRVYPYGGPKDDWLDLDRDAFSTSGFKLNRGQIVGRACITQADNPYLSDQTNREGLKDGPEKDAFVRLLAATMEWFRLFVVNVDEEISRASGVAPADVIERFRAEDGRIESLLPDLTKALSGSKEGAELSRRVRSSLTSLREAASLLEAASRAQVQERGRLMHLASIGLLIEVLAHELYRATDSGLKTIAKARSTRDANSTSTSLRVLDAQLRTLQKRLKVLDPLSTNARQTKERFELGEWVREIVDVFAGQRGRPNIVIRTVVVPRSATHHIRAVKGMLVQVIENLLSNSVHWITQKDRYERGPRGDRAEDDPIGTITVTVEPLANRVLVTDDGPGIPEDRRELVFQPFFTTKRQKEGRGLGLYIAREIAEYHGGSLTLGEADEDGNINTVVLSLGADDDE